MAQPLAESKSLAFGLCLKQAITCRTVGSPPWSPLMYSCWMSGFP